MSGHPSYTEDLTRPLANGWLADEYERASALIDAEVFLAAADEVGR